nr:uncharacterized protein zgc:109986 isoform X1 [Syngnathus scovelli]XP_049596192.1 uncharacterized protein zgc:109986 isoform X1 [Syngnathus scovelli]
MGKSNSKQKPLPRHELKCKDWKLMEEVDPENVKYLDKWITDYKFDGQLKTNSLNNLKQSIDAKCGVKKNKDGYYLIVQWELEAEKRKCGQMRGKLKDKEDEEKIKKNLLLHRQEDDETVSGRARLKAEADNAMNEDEKNDQIIKTEIAARQSEPIFPSLYPKLPNTDHPPEYSDSTRGMLTRSRAKLGPSADAYPMIEVANPHDDGGPTILVYRTWTQADIKSAIEGIAMPTEDVDQYCIDMKQLIASYNLRGDEVQQAFMASLTKHWASVKGTWNPFDSRGRPLECNRVPLQTEIDQLLGRIKIKFERRANYTDIGRTKQKEDELFEDFRHRLEKVFKANSGLEHGTDVYDQQLKNALHANSRPAIQNWITKHMITFPTSTLPQFIDHAIHAEKVVNSKRAKEKGKTGTIFLVNGEQSEMFYQNKTFEPRLVGRGRNKFRGKGSGGYSRDSPNYKTNDQPASGQSKRYNAEPPICWSCGKKGHIARNCPGKGESKPPL